MTSSSNIDHNKSLKLVEGSCAPTFAGMLNISRNSGYTQSTALNELYDNSKDAEAKNIVTHIHTEDKNTSRIVVRDDGRGMNSPGLRRGWQMAGDERSDRPNGSIGKFDIGLKGATLSMCKDITIASRKENESVTCLHADVDMMKANNQFEPTEFTENANRDHLLKYFHPHDVDAYLAQTSGTMIQMKVFLPEMVSTAETTFNELKKEIAIAYSHLPHVSFFIKQDNDDQLKVTAIDVFYRSTPSAIKYMYDTELAVYQPDRIGCPYRVIEKVTETRKYHGGVAHAGQYYEHSESKAGSRYSECMEEISPIEVEKMKSKLIGSIKAHMIQVTDATYAAEPVDDDNKGFHMVREVRKIASSLRLGCKFPDRENHACDRQRMEVVFPSALDKVVGSTWNKTMRDGPFPQKVVGDALYRIYKQRAYAWVKETERDLEQSRAHSFLDLVNSDESDTESVNTTPSCPPVPTTFLSIAQVVPKNRENVKEEVNVEVPTTTSIESSSPSPSVEDSSIPQTELPPSPQPELPMLCDNGIKQMARSMLEALSILDMNPSETILFHALRTYLGE